MISQSDWLEQNLFNTISKEEFFANIQGKTWFHIKLTDEAVKNLPSWEELNQFLSNHRLSHPRVRVAREGATDEELTILNQRSTLRGESIYETLQNRVYDNLKLGSTLVLDAIDIAIPQVRQIASSITKTFLVKSQANGYLTFSESRGFGLHWDDHDVFIVQVHGTKTWHLYGNTRVAPMHRDFHENHTQPTDILKTIELTPGSLLYVPRGCWHDVVGKGDPTFHLTFGVTPPTGIDLLVWLQEIGRQKEVLRQDIPLHLPKKFEDHSNKIRQVISDLLEGDLIAKFIDDVKRSTTSYPIFSFPYGISENAPSANDIISLIPSTFNINIFEEDIVIEANNLKWELPKIALKLLHSLQKRNLTIEESWETCCSPNQHTLQEWSHFLNSLITQGLISVSSPKG